MKFNTFSYIQTDTTTQLTELQALGFDLSPDLPDKENVEHFVRKVRFLAANSDWALQQLLADWETDLLAFFQSEQEMSADVFYQVAFQLLGFVPHFDYTDVDAFVTETQFPISYGSIIDNLYQLLTLRTKSGNTLIDQLVSDDLIPEDNAYHFFNGKALATFSTKDLIREVVYVEAPVDTDKDGKPDLVKVSILRPRYAGKLPAMMTQSPYHQGVNEVESDKMLHKMEGELTRKPAGSITVSANPVATVPTTPITDQHVAATEKTGHMGHYTLNDYMLARGFASLYVSGIGTFNSDGFMTSGDYQQVLGFKAVVDWLNGRAVAFTDHSRRYQTKALWASGAVATTGLSYLGTLSNALATTGVNGLKVIIAEAGISSWYHYYRENGLVCSPGGYPGEDLDSLAALTYSKALQGGDWLRHKDFYQAEFQDLRDQLDRTSGDYNPFWDSRNYLPQADKVSCEVVFTHGSQDWNVKPIHVYQMFHALPKTVHKHLFFHHGAHVYMNNWQSIDFRESMNALLCRQLLDKDNGYHLPAVIWQENNQPQTWTSLSDFDSKDNVVLPLGEEIKDIFNRYEEETFQAYCKSFTQFHAALRDGKAQQLLIDLPVTQDLLINGQASLRLRVKSSIDKGLLSMQLLDLGNKKQLAPIPAPVIREGLDNGRYHAQENLMELPFVEMPHRLITKSHINLQNRTDLLTIEPLDADQWVEVNWPLQPTIYRLKKGDTLRLILYTTDFENTIRDNGEWTISVDLEHSQLVLPAQ